MKNIIIMLLLCSAAGEAQSLKLPPRNALDASGSQLYLPLAAMPRSVREDSLFNIVMRGNVPQFMRRLVPVTSSKTINGTLYTLEYYVTPDYLSVGSDSDYFLMPMTPMLAQKIANAVLCILPTAMMVDQIYAAAKVKLRPQPIPPDADMDKVPRFFQHNDSVRSLRAPLLGALPLGSLVGGTKKDVVIDKKVYSWIKPAVPKPVVIYGWHQLNGVPIQPTYNGHGETYADYSHGIRLVQRMAAINGAEISLIDILQDPVYRSLISDTVLVKPFYGSLTDAESYRGPLPKIFELKQNYPNPFNPTTNVEFQLSSFDDVSLKVFDSLGREIATLIDQPLDAGTYRVQFGVDGLPLASGVYYYRLTTTSLSQTQKMVFLR